MDMIEYTRFYGADKIIDTLIDQSKKPHKEYCSVKLYGKSALMLDIIRTVMCRKKYSDILIAYIDMISPAIDSVCRDEYVLCLTDDMELGIESCWNKDDLFRNEAKFAIFQDGLNPEIMENIIKEDSSLLVAKINYYKQ